MMKTLLMTVGLWCAAGAMAAPGDLDTSFGSQGWKFWTGASGEDVCIDHNHSIVVAASRPPDGASGARTHLLRYYPSGLVHFFPNNAVWLPLGISTDAAQRPRIACTNTHYGVVSLGPELVPQGPRNLRLDVVSYAGTISGQTWLDHNLRVRSGAPALVPLDGGWLIGQTRTAGGSNWHGLLQRWDGISTPYYVAAFDDSFIGSTAAYYDVVRSPNGSVFVAGGFASASTPTDSQATLLHFDSVGNPNSSLFPGGRLTVYNDRPAEARRIALGPQQEIYLAAQRPATAQEGPSIALHRLTFAPSTFATQIIPDATLGDLAVDDFGRVVVVGERLGAAFVRRYVNHLPDASFGVDGERRFGFGSTRARFNAVAFDAVRRIVVVGRREAAQRGSSYVPDGLILARVLSQ